MKIYFSPPVTIVCLLLAAGMVRLAFWQWERHGAKQEFIRTLEDRLERPPTDLSDLLSDKIDVDALIHRRVTVEGEFDYKHEVVLRNRRREGVAGVHVITPLKVSGTSFYILVNRGFLPLALAERDKRRETKREPAAKFMGLIKAGTVRRLLAPKDPESGPGHPWVDAWLRIDISAIQRQLPYKLVPFYLEMLNRESITDTLGQIVSSSSAKEELLVLPMPRSLNHGGNNLDSSEDYPIPAFETVIPPGRHLGYVYEWSFMATLTLIIGVVLQLRPRRNTGHPQPQRSNNTNVVNKNTPSNPRSNEGISP